MTIGSHRADGETMADGDAVPRRHRRPDGDRRDDLRLLSLRRAGGGLPRKVGINVLVQLSAFILTCIGIQIAWSGISELIAELGH